MSIRDTVKLTRLQIMRTRARTPPACDCENCRQMREIRRGGNPFAFMMARGGAQEMEVEIDPGKPVPGKAH